jgi:hypothetical protein
MLLANLGSGRILSMDTLLNRLLELGNLHVTVPQIVSVLGLLVLHLRDLLHQVIALSLNFAVLLFCLLFLSSHAVLQVLVVALQLLIA